MFAPKLAWAPLVWSRHALRPPQPASPGNGRRPRTGGRRGEPHPWRERAARWTCPLAPTASVRLAHEAPSALASCEKVPSCASPARSDDSASAARAYAISLVDLQFTDGHIERWLGSGSLRDDPKHTRCPTRRVLLDWGAEVAVEHSLIADLGMNFSSVDRRALDDAPVEVVFRRHADPAPTRLGMARAYFFGRTVMLPGLLVVTAPALSVARTVSTWLPAGTFLHVYEYGAVNLARAPSCRRGTRPWRHRRGRSRWP